ncbi:MAG: hypothetical protein GTO16_01545 [Candidatus Aminicenantes bacterium]|nr:hypothetical protein [Candidatus Aminicenantes bacterium]
MVERRLRVFFVGLFVFLGYFLLLYSQAELSVKDIIEKNIQAAGGHEALSKVKNYSFKHGLRTYYMAASGLMKQTEGKEPVITEIILVEEDKVRRNCFNNITELAGLLKSTYQCLAKLRSGLFTLANFKGQLEFKGQKKFGPENLYMVTTDIGNLKVEFYLDSDEFTLKRLVFKGFDESRGRYAVNHDFGPYQQIDGIMIPSSWYSSQVGTRGSNFGVSDVKINPSLDKDFFSSIDVNVGDVKIAEGALSGSIVESSFRRNMLLISTNWTDKCIEGAGFKSKDKLILQMGDREIEIDFYESFPPRETIGPGSKFMVPNRSSKNYIIYLISPEFKQLLEELEPLLPIRVKKIK